MRLSLAALMLSLASLAMSAWTSVRPAPRPEPAAPVVVHSPPIVQVFLPGEPPFFRDVPQPEGPRPVFVTNRARGRQQVVRRAAPAPRRQQVARRPVRRRRVG